MTFNIQAVLSNTTNNLRVVSTTVNSKQAEEDSNHLCEKLASSHGGNTPRKNLFSRLSKNNPDITHYLLKVSRVEKITTVSSILLHYI